MKKLNLLFAILAIATIGFMSTGCGDEEGVGPSMTLAGGTFIDEDATVAPSGAIAFSWTVTAGDANLEKFTIKIGNNWAVDNGGYEWNGETDPATWNKETYVGAATFTADAQAGTMVFTLTATDKDGLTTSKTITITVEGTPVAGDIETATGKILGGQSNQTVGSYYDVEAATVSRQDAASSNQGAIDLVYYYGSQNKATLVAPNDPTVDGYTANSLSLCKDWTIKNATKLAETTITATAFDAIDDDTEIAALTGITASKLNDIAVGDVIAFELVSGKKGLVKVTALNAVATGTMTVDVKVQE